jgi:hypothetical protein
MRGIMRGVRRVWLPGRVKSPPTRTHTRHTLTLTGCCCCCCWGADAADLHLTVLLLRCVAWQLAVGQRLVETPVRGSWWRRPTTARRCIVCS